MTNSELDKYKVDHLFLLIGENPLPNYVAAHLLLNKGGTPYLVHTTGTTDKSVKSGTSEQAKQLAEVLKKDLPGCSPPELVSIEDHESDGFQIRDRIERWAKPLKGRLGLNYTGGTKAMAVHAYQALLNMKKADTVFSYLDPRRLKMRIDELVDDGIPINADNLQVSLNTLFQIHGLTLAKPYKSKVILPDVIKVISQNYNEWDNWVHKNLSSQVRKEDGRKWKSKTELQKVKLEFKELPAEITNMFDTLKLIDAEGCLLVQELKKQGGFSDITDAFKWLEGIWLEYHVLQAVSGIAKENSIGDYGLDFAIPLSGTKQGFQFDIAFMRGYQLFAISCTTDNEPALCKSKLFEASIRAQQMGGSEARVALMCCFDDPDSLKSELASLLGENQVTVFGREHLDDLPRAISQWIKDQGGKS
jgi:hypothetical protein